MTHTNQENNIPSCIEQIPISSRTPSINVASETNAPPTISMVHLSDFCQNPDINWQQVLETVKKQGTVFSNLKEQAEEFMEQKGLIVNNSIIPFMHIPLPVSHEMLGAQAEELRSLSAIINKIEQYARDGKLPEIVAIASLGLNEYDARILEAALTDSPYDSNKNTNTRWDTFLTMGTDGKPILKAIELNRMAPEGLHYAKILIDYAAKFAEHCNIGKNKLRPVIAEIYDWLITHYREHPQAKTGKPNICIAIGGSEGHEIKQSELPYVLKTLEELNEIKGHAAKIFISRIEDIHLDQNGKPFVIDNNGHQVEIDLTWVNVDNMEQSESPAFWKMMTNPGKYPITIDGLSRIGASKYIQSAALWLPHIQEALDLTDYEKELIAKHIPFAVDPAISPEIIVNGEKLNTLEFLYRWKDHLITKPSIGTHGHGFAAGINHTFEEWEQIIRARCNGGHIFQIRVPYTMLEMPIIDKGGIEMRYMCIDTNIQLVNGHEWSVISRCTPAQNHSSTLGTMNVAGGGGVVPVLAI